MTLLATGLNPNPTYFDTSRSETDGVSVYSFPVDQDELDLSYDENGNVFYAFSAETTAKASPDENEKILGSKFIPIETAMTSRDMITCASAGQLFSHLRKQLGYIVPQDQPTQITTDVE